MQLASTCLNEVGSQGVRTPDEPQDRGFIAHDPPQLPESFSHEGTSLLGVDRVHLVNLRSAQANPRPRTRRTATFPCFRRANDACRH